jgi:hypothetical protein
MSEIKFTSIAIKRDTTLPRLQRISKFGETYNDIVEKLLDRCERELLEQAAEEALTITTK